MYSLFTKLVPAVVESGDHIFYENAFSINSGAGFLTYVLTKLKGKLGVFGWALPTQTPPASAQRRML